MKNVTIATPFGPMSEHEYGSTRRSREVLTQLLGQGLITQTFAVILLEKITRWSFAKLMFSSWKTLQPTPTLWQRVKLTLIMLGHFIFWSEHEPEIRNWLILQGLIEERRQLERDSRSDEVDDD